VPRRRKTLITICDHKPRGRQGETTSAISQDRIGYPEPALQQKTEEREKRRATQLRGIDSMFNTDSSGAKSNVYSYLDVTCSVSDVRPWFNSSRQQLSDMALPMAV